MHYTKTGIALLALLGASCRQPSPTSPVDTTPTRADHANWPGHALYQTHCASCHGEDGSHAEAPLVDRIWGEAASWDLLRFFAEGHQDTSVHGSSLWYTYTLDESLDATQIMQIHTYIVEGLARSSPTLTARDLVTHECEANIMEKEVSPRHPFWEDYHARRQALIQSSTCSSDQALARIASAQTPSQAMLDEGRHIYQSYCAACHGEMGRGQGPAAAALQPPPTNFGDLSAWQHGTGVEDVLRVLDEGIEDTSMASYRNLSEDEQLALTAYVRAWLPEEERTSREPPSEWLITYCTSLEANEHMNHDPCHYYGIPRGTSGP